MDERRVPEPGCGASIVIERRIDWMDTDAAGVHHNTVVLRLAEAAEAVLHTRLSIVDTTFGRTPRVRSEINFRAPLHFNDLARTHLWVEELGTSSLRYGFTVHHDSTLVADGLLTIVLLDPAGERPIEWLPELRTVLLTGQAQSPELLTRADVPEFD